MAVALRTRRTPKKPEQWQPVFLDALRQTANVRESSVMAGIGYVTAYAHRNVDPEFAQGWEAALQEAADRLEREAWRRAHEGVEEPVFQGGRMVGTVRKYSDTLLIFLLKGARPQKYREVVRQEHTGADGAPIEVIVRRVNGPNGG